jgi:hypothetical protein
MMLAIAVVIDAAIVRASLSWPRLDILKQHLIDQLFKEEMQKAEHELFAAKQAVNRTRFSWTPVGTARSARASPIVANP